MGWALLFLYWAIGVYVLSYWWRRDILDLRVEQMIWIALVVWMGWPLVCLGMLWSHLAKKLNLNKVIWKAKTPL